MTTSTKTAMQISWRQLPLIFGVALITWVIHEAAHWLAGTMMGYSMWITLNGVGLQDGAYQHDWQPQLVTAAGPIVTIAQGIIAYLIVRRRASLIAFWFVFMAFMMRFGAMVVSLITPNDEARLGIWLSIGPWALFIAVTAFLLTLAILAGRRLSLGWKDYIIAYLLVSLIIPIIIYIGQIMPRLHF